MKRCIDYKQMHYTNTQQDGDIKALLFFRLYKKPSLYKKSGGFCLVNHTHEIALTRESFSLSLLIHQHQVPRQ